MPIMCTVMQHVKVHGNQRAIFHRGCLFLQLASFIWHWAACHISKSAFHRMHSYAVGRDTVTVTLSPPHWWRLFTSSFIQNKSNFSKIVPKCNCDFQMIWEIFFLRGAARSAPLSPLPPASGRHVGFISLLLRHPSIRTSPRRVSPAMAWQDFTAASWGVGESKQANKHANQTAFVN